MLLQILSLALCVAFTAAVDCPESSAMTSEMRDALLESYSNVKYSCDLEKMVHGDFANCVNATSRQLDPDVLKFVDTWTDKDDPQKHMTMIRERWAEYLTTLAEIGCAYEKNNCEDASEELPYRARCYMRQFGTEFEGSGEEETDEEKRAAEEAEMAGGNVQTTTTNAALMTSSFGAVIFIVSFLI